MNAAYEYVDMAPPPPPPIEEAAAHRSPKPKAKRVPQTPATLSRNVHVDEEHQDAQKRHVRTSAKRITHFRGEADFYGLLNTKDYSALDEMHYLMGGAHWKWAHWPDLFHAPGRQAHKKPAANWQKEQSKWPGVKIDPVSGTVLELHLQQNFLQGKLPPAFSRLHCLRVLDLSKNRIRGSLTSELFGLPALVKLDLSFNHISGHLPPLPGARFLRTVRLARNNLVGDLPPTIKNLQALEWLDLSSNHLGPNLPVEFADMPKLRRVNLSSNCFSTRIPLAFVGPGMQEMDLRENSLSGFLPLDLMDHIENGMLDAHFKPGNPRLTSLEDSEASLDSPLWPFFLIPAQALLSLERLPTHEEARASSLVFHVDSVVRQYALYRLKAEDGTYDAVRRSECVFFSYSPNASEAGSEETSFFHHHLNHERREQETLEHMKQFLREHTTFRMCWVEKMCVPVLPGSLGHIEKRRALISIPYYVHSCGTLVSLLRPDEDVPSHFAWRRVRYHMLSSVCPFRVPAANNRQGIRRPVVPVGKPQLGSFNSPWQDLLVDRIISVFNGEFRVETPQSMPCLDPMSDDALTEEADDVMKVQYEHMCALLVSRIRHIKGESEMKATTKCWGDGALDRAEEGERIERSAEDGDMSDRLLSQTNTNIHARMHKFEHRFLHSHAELDELAA